MVLDKTNILTRFRLPIASLVEGMRTEVPSRLLNLGESPMAVDSRFTEGGELSKGFGYDGYGHKLDGVVTLVEKWRKFGTYPTPTDRLFAMSLKSCYYHSGTDWVRLELRYTTGTASVATGSKSVTGSGTVWSTTPWPNVQHGDRLKIDSNGWWYTVDSVGGPTAITLVEDYAGYPGASGQAYTVDKYLTAAEGSRLPSVCGLNDSLVVCNGYDPLMAWDGDAAYMTCITSVIDFARFVLSWGDRVIALAPTESGTSYVRRIRWSVPNSLTDWAGIGSGYADLDNTPGDLIAAMPIASTMVIFKSDSIAHASLTGVADAPFAIDERLEQIGLIGPKALIAKGETGCYFIGSDFVVYEYDKFQLREIDKPIRNKLIESINKTELRRSTLLYIPEWQELLMLVPEGSSEAPTAMWVYSTRTGKWCPRQSISGTALGLWKGAVMPTLDSITDIIDSVSYTIDGGPGGSGGDIVLCGAEEGDVKQFSPDMRSRGGSSFESYWETNDFDMHQQDASLVGTDKTLLQIRVYYKSLGSGASLVVGISKDAGFTYPWQKTVTLEAGAADELKWAAANVMVTGNVFRVRLSNTSIDESFKLHHLEVLYVVRGESVS